MSGFPEPGFLLHSNRLHMGNGRGIVLAVPRPMVRYPSRQPPWWRQCRDERRLKASVGCGGAGRGRREARGGGGVRKDILRNTHQCRYDCDANSLDNIGIVHAHSL